jgi:predicted nucleotidyltransferase
MHLSRSSLAAFSNLANSSGFRNFSASTLKRDEVQAISKFASVEPNNLWVFGSVARVEARPESDLDIFVEIEPGLSFNQNYGVA